MSIPVFYSNKIVRFVTSYDKDGDNLTGWRYYLLWKIKEREKIMIFFPLTSNHNHQNIIFVSQYKISAPRPLCLQSDFYLNSFVNTNRLVIVPYSVLNYLKLCQKCPSLCLSKEDFQEIAQLHNNLPKYRMKVREIKLEVKDFI